MSDYRKKHTGRWIFLLLILALFVSCGSEPAIEETDSSAAEQTVAETTPPEPVYRTLTLAGEPVSAYSFRYGTFVNPEAAQAFADYLSSEFGMREGEDGVVFDLSVSVKTSGQASAVVDGNVVTVSAGSNGGLSVVFDRIMEQCGILPDADAEAPVALESAVEAEYTYTLFETDGPAESYKLTARTDKDPTSYAVGEPMQFYFELTCNGEVVPCTEMRCSVHTDEGYIDVTLAPGEDGRFYYTHTMSKPGCIEVRILARGDVLGQNGMGYFKGKLVEKAVSACADFDKINVAYEEPTDFDAFWEKAMAKLEGIDPRDAEVTEYLPGSEYGREGYRVYHVKVPTDKDPAVGFLTIPENAEPGTLGIRMNFIGYGNGKAGPCTNPDAITFQVCAHSIDCDIDQEKFDAIFNARNLYSYGLSSSDYRNPQNAYFAGMIKRNVQALRYAETLPEWDGENVYAGGMSQGAFQSVSLAALCPEVNKLYLEVPWMCNLGVNKAKNIPSSLTPPYTRNVLYFDTVFFARRISGASVTMKIGMTDNLAPITGTTALFNNLRGCDRTATFYQSVGHGGWKDTSEAYVKEASAES